MLDMASDRRHFGLIGMRERAARMRASVAISSKEGLGNEIAVAIPASMACAPRSTPQAGWWWR